MNGQFWKWREASAIVQLPDRVTHLMRAQNGSNIVFAARNLHLWTNFWGIDPRGQLRCRRLGGPERVPDRRRADVLHCADSISSTEPNRDDIMTSIRNRARCIAAYCAAAAVVAVAVAACNVKQELLAPQNPGLIDPVARLRRPRRPSRSRSAPLGATTFVVDCGGNSECLWEEIGNLTDEYHNADFQNTRQDIDQRSMGDDNPSNPYTSVSAAARIRARRDRRGVEVHPRQHGGHRARCTTSLAFLELSLAENFCNGIPLGHTIIGRRDVRTGVDRRYRCSTAHPRIWTRRSSSTRARARRRGSFTSSR